MGRLRDGLRACAAECSDPGEVLQRLNRLCLHQNMGSMATVVYAVLNPVLVTLHMASAGHHPPLLVSGEGRGFLESEPCPPIDAMREGAVPHHAARAAARQSAAAVHRRARRAPGRCGRGGHGGAARSGLSPRLPGRDLEGVCDAVLAGTLDGRPTDDDVASLAVAAAPVLGPLLDVMLPAQPEQLAVLRAPWSGGSPRPAPPTTRCTRSPWRARRPPPTRSSTPMDPVAPTSRSCATSTTDWSSSSCATGGSGEPPQHRPGPRTPVHARAHGRRRPPPR